MVTASDIERTVANELREVQEKIDRWEKERKALMDQRREITLRLNDIGSYVAKAKARRWTLHNEPPIGIRNSPSDTEWLLTDDVAAVIREWLDERPDRTVSELSREAKMNARRIRQILGSGKGRTTFTTWRIFEQLALAMGRYDLMDEGSVRVWSLHSKRIYDKVLREQRNGRRKHN